MEILKLALLTFIGVATMPCIPSPPQRSAEAIAVLDVNDPVYDLSLSPDGKTLATVLETAGDGPRPKEIKLWDTETKHLKRALGDESRGTLVVRFSPDGKSLVGCNEGNTVRVWDAETGQLKQTLTASGHTGTVHSLAFSPDSRQLATAGFGKEGIQIFGKVMLWDMHTGSLMFTIEQRELMQTNAVAFSPDGSTLATGGFAHREESKPTGDVTVWSAKSGARLLTLDEQTFPVQSVAFAPDGNRLAVATYYSLEADQPRGGVIQLFESKSGRLRRKMTGHTDLVWRVVFSADGRLLASAGAKSETEGGGGEVILWDAETGELAAKLTGHQHVVTSVAFTPDSKQLWTASRDATVRLWRIKQAGDRP